MPRDRGVNKKKPPINLVISSRVIIVGGQAFDSSILGKTAQWPYSPLPKRGNFAGLKK